ncbi:alpha/beta hydrolase [Agromyces sp. G08B096]|uniref:Alpha/beta hydrolase n=1 Tax=Agromyces sp. G08B096 TaxID=3156399 RepID=A0AAU7W5C2_9MICO
MSETIEVRFLSRPEGRISYTVAGAGPLVVAAPGMGDLRDSYRDLAGPLIAAGYRVAVTDLRSHGDSDTGFTDFSDAAVAGDLIALVRELGGPAVLIGSSLSGAAAAIAAAREPGLVAGVVGLGALLRNPDSPAIVRTVMPLVYRVALARPWGAAFWGGFYRSINRGRTAPWLDEHVAAVAAKLREPGRLRDLRRLTLALDHEEAERALPAVRAPMLQVVGLLDPDFPDPAAEAEWFRTLGARVVEVPEAGHYPHAQRPDVVVPEVVAFADGLRSGDEWRMPRA